MVTTAFPEHPMMRTAALSLALASTACSSNSQGTAAPAAVAEPAPSGASGSGASTKVAGEAPAVVDLDYDEIARRYGIYHQGSLEPLFPEVEVEVAHGFAHDMGDYQEVSKAKVAGKDVDVSRILAAVVASRGGWSKGGGRSDDDVMRTARQFVDVWDVLLGAKRIDVDKASASLLHAAKGQARRRSRPAVATPAEAVYQPPGVAIYDLGDRRVVVVTRFSLGHIADRGQLSSYDVASFDVADGSPFYDEKAAIPQPAQIWD